MIEPMMATMLGFVTTDAAVAPALLQRALKAAVDETFNAITVDGECSTNDCVFALANGASGVELDRDGLAAARRALAAGLRAAGDRHRPRRRRRDQADHDPGDRRGIQRRARSDGARDRQLAARQDGRARRRPELGPARGRRRTRRRSAFTLEQAAVRIGRSSSSPTARRYDERAPEAAEYLQGKDIDARGRSRHRGQRAVADVDVRSERRIRPDQRGVPDLS